MNKMADWFKGLKVTLGILIGAVMLGITIGASSVGWLTLPGEVAALTTRQSADSLITAQNRRSITDLRVVTTSLTGGQATLLELVRTIDRRTCISSASNEAELVECADR